MKNLIGCVRNYAGRIVRNIIKMGKIIELRTRFRLHIMDAETTINYIQKNHCSIARYGDGEFNLMLGSKGISFQSGSAELAQKLCGTLSNKNPNLLICIPWSFNHLKYRNFESRSFWIQWSLSNDNQKRISQEILRYTGKKYLFGDAQITRPYIAMNNSLRAQKLFPMLQSLWKERDVLIVEGEHTCLGVGNDLFSNARSIRRIIAPATNDFPIIHQSLI